MGIQTATNINISEVSQFKYLSDPRDWLKRLRGWRITVLGGLCLTCLVLLANATLLIWGYRAALDTQNGILTIYRTHCPEVKRISLWSHLLINTLGTLLLSASTACMQCVSTPTRVEVDEAHEKGVWLHVGVLGFCNFRHISKWRRFVWIMLACSSIPIHLLYNSVIFSTEILHDYSGLVVTKDFLTGSHWNISDEHNFGDEWFSPKNYWQIQDLQDHVDALTPLDPAACVQAYDSLPVSGWGSVLFVTNVTGSPNSLLRPMSHSADSSPRIEGSLQDFICRISPEVCVLYSNITWRGDVVDWQVVLYRYDYDLKTAKSLNVTVESCLAQKVAPACTLNLSSPALIAVIFCNLIKLVCFVIVTIMTDFRPLITIGDAIASLLTQPDATTMGSGPISAVDVMRMGSRHFQTRFYELVFKPWKPTRHFWFAATSRRRWAVTLTFCLVAWVSCLVLLVLYGQSEFNRPSISNVKDWWTRGLGGQTLEDLMGISSDLPIISTILLANTPQLLVSLIYILYNGVFTSMLLTAETLAFSTKRKTLRVSQPQGAQRSTYWLQLPYRYAIPLMIAMGLLHWLISQSIYIIRVAIVDVKGKEDLSRSLNGCGWSPLGLFLSILLGGLLIVNLVGHGFRRYTDKMPILSSCSLAIAAACHRSSLEDDDMAQMPLQFGVISSSDGTERRVGFSTGEVESYT